MLGVIMRQGSPEQLAGASARVGSPAAQRHHRPRGVRGDDGGDEPVVGRAGRRTGVPGPAAHGAGCHPVAAGLPGRREREATRPAHHAYGTGPRPRGAPTERHDFLIRLHLVDVGRSALHLQRRRHNPPTRSSQPAPGATDSPRRLRTARRAPTRPVLTSAPGRNAARAHNAPTTCAGFGGRPCDRANDGRGAGRW